MHPAELRRFLHKRPCYDQRTERRILKALECEPLPVPAIVVRTKLKLLQSLTAEFQAVRKAIAGYDADIERLTKDDEEARRFRALPGAGSIVSGGLYCLFSEDRRRFGSATEVRCFTGTVPRTIQGGKMRCVSFRYGCNHFFWTLLQWYAFSSLRCSEWAKRYYCRKRRECKSYHHALRCLAALWLKVIYAMWRNRQEYNEERHLASIAREQMRLAEVG